MNILSTALNVPQGFGNRLSGDDRGRPGRPWAIAALLMAGVMTGLVSGVTDRAIAMEPTTTSGSPLPSRFEFTPPPNAPRPASSTGTASRDSSPTRSRLIVPQDSQWGLTLSQRPTFLAYVAEVDPTGTASFAITREGTEETICSARLENISANRFLRLESCAELTVGQTYRWTLSLPKPTGDTATDRTTLVGFVKVADDVTPLDLGAAPGMERVVQYGKAGVWYEAVTELATLWEASPTSRQVMSDWASLLAIAGLDLDPATLQATPIAAR